MTNIHLLNVAPLITVVQCLALLSHSKKVASSIPTEGLYFVVRSCSLCVCVGCLKCQSVRVWMFFFPHVFECVAPAVTHLHPQHCWGSSNPPKPPEPLPSPFPSASEARGDRK